MNNNKKMLLIVIVGAIFALLTAVLLSGGKEQAKIDDSEFILISRVDMQPGTFIKINDHLSYVDMSGKKPETYWMRKKNTDVTQFEGAVVRRLIRAGEVLNKANIVTPKEGGFMSAVLYPGMRAVSVGVDAVSSNAGFIFPGDKVDLLLTHEVESVNNARSHVTETVVENVRVLAIDQKVDNTDNKAMIPKTVTLEVTPKQAEEVLVAEELGKISLILRSQGGVETLAEKTFTRDSDVSKVINESRPSNNTGTVSVTRGHTGSK